MEHTECNFVIISEGKFKGLFLYKKDVYFYKIAKFLRPLSWSLGQGIMNLGQGARLWGQGAAPCWKGLAGALVKEFHKNDM